MDYAKINRRSVYGLTIEVFLRNLPTFVIVAIGSAFASFAQAMLGPFSFMVIPVSFYLSSVTMIVTHKTIVTGHAVQTDEAFEITDMLKIYFWQYLGMNAIPVIIMFAGTITLFSGAVPMQDAGVDLLIVFGISMLVYNLFMALFGTSLVATALGGDGMMMVTRGRITFWYSLIRLLVLPTLVIAAIGGGFWFYFSQMGAEGSTQWLTALIFSVIGNLWNGVMMLIGMNLMLIFITLISGVILTKAFILAEATMAAQGEPTNWGQRAFGIDPDARRVVFK